MGPCVLDASHHLGRNHVPSHSHDEKFSKIRVKNEFRRNPRVGAAKDRSVRLLASGQSSQCFLANGGKARLARHKSLVTFTQPAQPFFGGRNCRCCLCLLANRFHLTAQFPCLPVGLSPIWRLLPNLPTTSSSGSRSFRARFSHHRMVVREQN